MSRWRQYFLVLLSLFLCQRAIAQDEKGEEAFLEADLAMGRIVPHPELDGVLLNNFYQALDLRFSKQTTGDNFWNQLYRYPSYGFGVSIINFPEDVLGYPFSMYGFMNFTMVRRKKFEFNNRISVGTSFLKPFSEERNPKNNAIGSTMNVHIDVRFEGSWQVGQQTNLNFGGHFTHFSNGSYQKPNLGLNLYGLYGGIDWYFNPKRPTFKRLRVPELKSKGDFTVMLAIGQKQLEENGDRFMGTTVSMAYNFQWQHKCKYPIGIDIFYNEYYESFQNDKSTSIAVKSGFEQIYNKLTLFAQVAVYVFNEPSYGRFFYERLGLRYKIYNELFGSVSVKAHLVKAEMVEWGIGYRFRK